jgi:hypothetical protein
MHIARSRRTMAAVLCAMLASGAGWAGIPGDLDNNGCVDQSDLGTLLANYPCTGCDCAGDADGDGDTDQSDLGSILANYGTGAGCTGATVTDLAGNLLGPYPFFDYVRAFNASDTIRVAIDPTRFPGVVGATGHVYVVKAKTAAEWVADPTLSDVAGGPQTVSFVGGTIQANTFVLTTPGQLSGDAGVDIGVGYDVVLDLNQDGKLNLGDVIDGGSGEAGLYVFKDLTTPGPLPVTYSASYDVVFPGLSTSFDSEITSYPTNIASLGKLPMVIISHGVGHSYTGYQYLQDHLASYGYVVVAHTNNVSSIPNCADTTLKHTDAFIANLPTILGGVLNGHIDTSRIVWIGHSRGGEGVARAYTNLLAGSYVPVNYSINDIKLISSIAPTAFDTGVPTDVKGATYHLIYGAADADVSGAANCPQCQSFRLFERATKHRFSTYIHGVGHNDFYCCGSSVASGPALIGRPETQQIAKIVWLTLIKHVIEGNIGAKDFLWRQWETLRPTGILTTDVVDNEYKDGSPCKRIIDDFQTGAVLHPSSSGGAVTADVSNVVKGQMREADGVFTWPGDAMNGMTRANFPDTTAGTMFDWTVGDQKFIEFAIVPALQDFSGQKYLSFRSAQGTRHTETIAELGDLTFTVTLKDANGANSSINIGAYGGGIEEVYQRTGTGVGTGWQNEFEVIRIRLTDFLHNGSGLDLSKITAVRFSFGSLSGSSRGRLGLDDLELVKD